MKVAAEIGMNFSEFWEITPYELSLQVDGYSKRKKADSEEKVTLAYTNAMWTIQWLSSNKKDRPQPLEKILDIKKEKKVMSSEQMLAQVKQLNALFGGSEVENG